MFLLSFLTSCWSFRFLQVRYDCDGKSTSPASRREGSPMITSFPGGLERRTVGSRGSFGLHSMWLRDMLLGWLFHCASISASRGYIIPYSKLKLWQILIGIRNCCFCWLPAQVQTKSCKFQVNAMQSWNDWFLPYQVLSCIHQESFHLSVCSCSVCSMNFPQRISEILTSKLFSKARLCRNISCSHCSQIQTQKRDL